MVAYSQSEYLFDHLVIITRDYLSELSQKFINQGFQLTPMAHHNLGSSNRLIMLETSYIELLGWSKGETPKRAEIANQEIGLDAIVFRTDDAQRCYEQLKKNGFSVSPVQNLNRQAEYEGDTVLVEFKTVRFVEQPVPGLRIYFCEHVTPKYVWQDKWLTHPNKISYLRDIHIVTQNIQLISNQFRSLLGLQFHDLIINEKIIQLNLQNISIFFHESAIPNLKTRISSIALSKSIHDPVDLSIDQQFFNHF